MLAKAVDIPVADMRGIWGRHIFLDCAQKMGFFPFLQKRGIT